jgi:hypothetical protein
MDRVRHVKRGSEYEVLHRGVELQVSTHRRMRSDSTAWEGQMTALREGARLVVYRGEDGKLWAREEAEFGDGRFEPVT